MFAELLLQKDLRTRTTVPSEAPVATVVADEVLPDPNRTAGGEERLCLLHPQSS